MTIIRVLGVLILVALGFVAASWLIPIFSRWESQQSWLGNNPEYRVDRVWERRGPAGLSAAELQTARSYALERIGAIRRADGLSELALDMNPTAQLLAEEQLANCYTSNWNIDGKKPYMSYLANGGIDAVWQYGTGANYCPEDIENYTILTIEEYLDTLYDATFADSAAREEFSIPAYRKVGIGVAYSGVNMWVVHLFATDFVEFSSLPSISDGILAFEYRMVNGASDIEYPPEAYLSFDRLPEPLTRGQLARTSCYWYGATVAGLLPRQADPDYWQDDLFEAFGPSCPDPHVNPPNTSPVTSYQDEIRIREESKLEVDPEGEQYVAQWIVADVSSLLGGRLYVEADVSSLLERYGEGTYTLTLWATVEGELSPVAIYPIFHDPTSVP